MAKKLNGEKELCDRKLLEKILSIVERQEKLPPPAHEGVDRFLCRFHYEAFAIGDELPKQEGGGYV